MWATEGHLPLISLQNIFQNSTMNFSQILAADVKETPHLALKFTTVNVRRTQIFIFVVN